MATTHIRKSSGGTPITGTDAAEIAATPGAGRSNTLRNLVLSNQDDSDPCTIVLLSDTDIIYGPVKLQPGSNPFRESWPKEDPLFADPNAALKIQAITNSTAGFCYSARGRARAWPVE